MKKLIFVIIIVISLLSCSEMTSSKRNINSDYVVTGLLREGSCVTKEYPIRVSRGIDANGGSISDTLLNVIEKVESVKIINTDNGIESYLSFFVESDSTSFNYGFYDMNEDIIFQSQKKYRLEIILEDENQRDSIWAETIIPEATEILPDTAFAIGSQPEDFPELKFETANSEHPLKIKVESANTIPLYFEFYCLEEWEDAEYIQDYPGVSDSVETEDEYENPQTGSPRTVKYFYTYNPSEENGEFIVTDNSYKYNFIFYGRYKFDVFAVEDNYYNYLYKTEGYRFGGINSSQNNSIGYFGAISGNTIYTKIVE